MPRPPRRAAVPEGEAVGPGRGRADAGGSPQRSEAAAPRAPRRALILVGRGRRCGERGESGPRSTVRFGAAAAFCFFFFFTFFFSFPPHSLLSLPVPPHYSNHRQADKNAPGADNGPPSARRSPLLLLQDQRNFAAPPARPGAAGHRRPGGSCAARKLRGRIAASHRPRRAAVPGLSAQSRGRSDQNVSPTLMEFVFFFFPPFLSPFFCFSPSLPRPHTHRSALGPVFFGTRLRAVPRLSGPQRP